jgi:hypothetical protein
MDNKKNDKHNATKTKKTPEQRLADAVRKLNPSDPLDAYQKGFALLADGHGEWSVEEVLTGATQGRTALQLETLAKEAARILFPT